MRSPLDQLQINNYLVYFGKVQNIQEIKVEPILLRKGNCRLAIYGIGHLRDERLNLALSRNKIEFVMPVENDGISYFKILVLH